MAAVIVLHLGAAESSGYSGKGLTIMGDSAQSLGRGGAGVSSSGIDLFSKNPASIADLEYPSLSLQYGALPESGGIRSGSALFAFPTSRGVLGWAMKGMWLDDAGGIREGYGFRFGWARDFSPSMKVGISLDFFASRDGTTNIFSGFTAGGIYRLPGFTARQGFGITAPFFGMALTAGVPTGKEKSSVDFNTLDAGYRFIFFRGAHMDLGFFHDITIAGGLRDMPVKTGIEWSILSKYTVRGGAVFNGPFGDRDGTFGLGYAMIGESFRGTITYSAVHERGKNFLHYLGADLSYASPDRDPPEITVTPQVTHLSPNDDGINDFVRFFIEVRDRSALRGWKFSVTGPDGSLVRVIKKFTVPDRRLEFSDRIARLFSSRESRMVPPSIIWDGRDRKGRIVPDGVYHYAFNAWDEHNNITPVIRGNVTVDNDPPAVTVRTPRGTRSAFHEKDGWNVSIDQEIRTSPEDQWSAVIRDTGGRAMRSYSWSGDRVPRKLAWDGRDNAGARVPAGAYEYFISGSDRGGNRAEGYLADIMLVYAGESADIQPDLRFLSHATGKPLRITVSSAPRDGITGWMLVITRNSEVVREIAGLPPVPREILWDCRDGRGKSVKDGLYMTSLLISGKNGAVVSSPEKPVLFDSEPLKLDFALSGKIFSPDGDDDDDLLIIKPRCSKGGAVRRWALSVYTHSGRLFRSFSGTGAIPRELVWNGLGTWGEEPESDIDYSIVMEAQDRAGNTAVTRGTTVFTGLLLLPWYRGYRIVTSSILFEYNSPEIREGSFPVLDRALEIMKKFENYEIVVRAHAVTMESEEKNLHLSERRSGTVGDYFIRKGLDKKRLTVAGMGGTAPLYPAAGEENIRRNQRVEILIIRGEE